MPEIRFTDDELRSIQGAQQQVDDTFEATFGRFRRWLDESDMTAIREHRREVVRREEFVRLGLESLGKALEERGIQGDRKAFVGEGRDAASNANYLGVSPEALGVVYERLSLTTEQQKRREEITAETNERFILAGHESVSVVEWTSAQEEALRREGLMFREDELNDLLYA